MTRVAKWVQDLVDEVCGPSKLEVGKRYLHPDNGVIEITEGQYWGTDGISNFWYWTELTTGMTFSGYGGSWPRVCGSSLRKMDGSRVFCQLEEFHYKDGSQHQDGTGRCWGSFRAR